MTSAESPKMYLLVKHLQRSPVARTARAARAGCRRQGVILDDGTRLRRKGRRRFTEVSLDTFRDNIGQFEFYVDNGYLAIFDHEERPVTMDQARAMVELSPRANPPVDSGPVPESEPELVETNGSRRESFSEDELQKLSRKRLDKLANQRGIDPSGFSNKPEIIKAILEVGG